MRRETLLLDNLNCPSCAAELERTLRRIPGVKKAELAFATGTLVLEYDDTQLSREQIAGTLADFSVRIAGSL